MKEIKEIPAPEFKSAKEMTPLEMNSIRFGKKHTVLTPQKLNDDK